MHFPEVTCTGTAVISSILYQVINLLPLKRDTIPTKQNKLIDDDDDDVPLLLTTGDNHCSNRKEKRQR